MIASTHYVRFPEYLRDRYEYGAPHYSLERTATGVRIHDGRYSTTSAPTIGEAVDYLRQQLARRKRAAGQREVDRIWESLCDHHADRIKQQRTARDLLAVEKARKLVAELGDRNYSVDLDYYATRKVQREAKAILAERTARRQARGIASHARLGTPDKIRLLIPVYAQRREAAKAKRLNDRLLAGKIGRDALTQLIAADRHLESVSAEADALVRCAVAAVGRIGEQAEDDLSRMTTSEDFSGKKSRNHKLERTTVCRIEHRKDWTAALVTLRDYKSFGSSRWGDGAYGSRGGSSFRCYLIVRDTTTGEGHILRVPPKYGNSDTQFFRSFKGAVERIHAAIAWTFSREPQDYAPQLTA